MPLVSIIIPAYGHAKFILQSIASVTAQTFSDYEIIVVNDGSPDNTEKVLESLIEQGAIRYFSQPNQGVAQARNYGISQATGKYIALLDDDDVWPPNKLEWQVKAMLESDLAAVGGLSAILGPSGLVELIEEDQKIVTFEFTDLFDGNPFISPGQVLISRAILLETGGFNAKIWGSDDYDMWMMLAAKGRILRKNLVALHYRVHDSNASRDHIKMILNSRKVIDKHLQALSGQQFLHCKRRAYCYMFNYMGGLLLRHGVRDILKPKGRTSIGIRKVITFFDVFGVQMLLDRKLFGIIVHRLIR